jgi:hypothetical protein
MNDAPEKIWAGAWDNGGTYQKRWFHAGTNVEVPVFTRTAYTRADISQARITELEAALYKVLVARTYDTIFDETEIWELEDIAREALKDTTNE